MPNDSAPVENSKQEWHPVFFAAIQLELAAEKDHLSFEREYPLGTKPLLMDVLVIKKAPDYQVSKNIGRIFRGHSIIEYKSPHDYLSLDDSYKALAYALLYKANAPHENAIDIKDITVTFVSMGYPEKVMGHWQTAQHCGIEQQGPGIYYITGSLVPIQVLVQRELSAADNQWLKGLTDNLKDQQLLNQILLAGSENSKNPLYESYLEMITTNNRALVLEVLSMGSVTFEELLVQSGWADKFQQKGMQDGKQQGIQEGKRQGRKETALNMLREGMDISLIVKVTKLSRQEVEQLAEQAMAAGGK